MLSCHTQTPRRITQTVRPSEYQNTQTDDPYVIGSSESECFISERRLPRQMKPKTQLDEQREDLRRKRVEDFIAKAKKLKSSRKRKPATRQKELW